VHKVRFITAALLLLAPISAGMAAEAVPDFSGYWVRPEAGNERMFYPPASGPGPLVNTDTTGEFTIGNHDAPILLPHAAAAVKANGDQGRAGNVIFPPWSLCWPTGVPLNLNMAEPVQFLQTRDQVTILYQRGMQIRRIDLGKPHPPNPKPSWYGYSVGRYEGGNTLVVDTIAQDTRSMVDRFGTPKSDVFRVVERYTVSPDRQRIDVAFTVTDPKTFTTTWSARMSYVPIQSRRGYDPMEAPFNEVVCAENNKDAAGGFYPIPVDDTPDF
jgi:hypothetical protein